MTGAAVAELEPIVGTKQACDLVGHPRASLYRARRPRSRSERRPRPAPANALSAAERRSVLDQLHCERFGDLAPPQVWATLLDEGTYLCSLSTMYRILRSEAECRDRRRQSAHPTRIKPELVAHGPNQVWSWDITGLRGPERGMTYDLYVIIDIFSRYVPGWMVAATETAELAEAFIAETLFRHRIAPDTLTIHADRGSSMTSKPVAVLLDDLGVARSHSRPHVSNDNPYSEAAFKTLKYCPDFPYRFGSIADARAFCASFFEAYNHHHRHSGIGLHTPASVHFGTAASMREGRAKVLEAAYAAHPLRFNKPPTPPKLPAVAWINCPESSIQSR